MNRKLYIRLLEDKVLELERELRIQTATLDTVLESRPALPPADPRLLGGKDDGYNHLRESADERPRMSGAELLLDAAKRSHV